MPSRELFQSIEQWGLVEPFWNAERRYLYIDQRKYWHMGNATSASPAERPTLIDRPWLDVSRYRENAKTLGYDEAALDPLAARWAVLLERARRDSTDAAVQMLGWTKTPHCSDLEATVIAGRPDAPGTTSEQQFSSLENVDAGRDVMRLITSLRRSQAGG